MAGLTKAQRAEKEAAKQENDNRSEQNVIIQTVEMVETGGQVDTDGPELGVITQHDEQLEFVRMTRDSPELPGGPVEADVHPEAVELWLQAEWRISE